MDAAISLLRELLKDQLGILKPSDHPQIERAIAILTAAQPLGDAAVPVLTEAGKVDKRASMSRLNDYLLFMARQNIGPIQADPDIMSIMDLLETLPEAK